MGITGRSQIQLNLITLSELGSSGLSVSCIKFLFKIITYFCLTFHNFSNTFRGIWIGKVNSCRQPVFN